MPATHTVLVVEDEATFRRILCRLLVEQGYHVLCAGSPAEAVRLGSDPENRIDLLLTDMGLPGASGYQVAGTLLRMHPDMLAIVMSGRAEADILEPPPMGRRLPHLLKPFPLDRLLQVISEQLAERERGRTAAREA